MRMSFDELLEAAIRERKQLLAQTDTLLRSHSHDKLWAIMSAARDELDFEFSVLASEKKEEQ